MILTFAVPFRQMNHFTKVAGTRKLSHVQVSLAARDIFLEMLFSCKIIYYSIIDVST